ncbi:uncharacterized protein [Haliotis cracherodii]|uniref:uncharacterized protein n=1 Tax=Haliotis cracherodii TaxID=6455 RepID=UPI0039E7A812
MTTAVCVIIAFVAVTIHAQGMPSSAQNSVGYDMKASNVPLGNTVNGIPLAPAQHPSPMPGALLSHASNVFNNNHPTAATNNHHANNAAQSPMNYLPFMMGGDNGRRMAMYSMMMNPRQSNNMMLPFAMMNGVDNMWPMMALMNNRNQRGGRGFDPMTMMLLGSEMM